MSSFYLDVLKDRLYTFGSDSGERRAAQWVLHQVLSTMTRLMAPVLSFTAEEVWQSLKQRATDLEDSVFLASFPEVNAQYYDLTLEEKWDNLFMLRNEVNKAIEIKRAEKFLGNSLEAKIILYLPEKYNMLVSENRDFLPTFFIVSAVELADGGFDDSYKSIEIEGLEVSVEKAIGAKCQRCWNRSEAVGTFKDTPDICDRCHKVILSR
jgi:isoleucyl-tRNA synthetase